MALLPPPPINTLPLGLLDVLGIRSGGEYPRFLTQQLDAGIDLLRLYLAAREESFVPAAFTVAATGFQPIAGLTVPSGEYWWIHSYTVRLLTGAAEAISASLAWRFDVNSALPAFIGVSDLLTLGASISGTLNAEHQMPLIASPGSIGLLAVESITGTIDGSCGLRITRLRI